MDTHDAFLDLQRRWNSGQRISLLNFNEDFPEEDKWPLEERLSIRSVSGQTPFMRGLSEELAGEMEIEGGEY